MVGDMATDLAARMRLFKPGQITWPEPELQQRCNMCRHAEWAPKNKIRCGLVRARHKTQAVAFDPQAVACSQFKFAGEPPCQK